MKEKENEWMDIIRKYNKPDPVKSWWQVVNSFGPYIILWILMIKSIQISYWITLFLSVFAAGFMIRIFIIFHACGHRYSTWGMALLCSASVQGSIVDKN